MARVPRGAPTGGQFAAVGASESLVRLHAEQERLARLGELDGDDGFGDEDDEDSDDFYDQFDD